MPKKPGGTRRTDSSPRTRKRPDDSPRPGAGQLDLGPLPGFIGYPLRRAQITVFEDFMRAAGKAGLRPGQFSTLVVIDANPGSKQTEVAAALGIQGTNFVAMINQLEERKLVERRPLDRRSYGLHLTPQGRTMLARALKLQMAQEARYEALLGAEGHRKLLALLEKITDAAETKR